MSVYGQGSAYSFKTGAFNPGYTNGMGQDPRQIVAKSGIDSTKGGVEYAGGSPGFPSWQPTRDNRAMPSSPYGSMFNKDADLTGVSVNPLFGGSNVSYDALRANMSNLQDPVAQLAGSAISAANPYAYGQGTQVPGFDFSRYAGGDISNIFTQAYNMLNASRRTMGQDMGDNRLGPGSWNPFGGDNRGTYRTWDDERRGVAPGPADGGYQQWLDYRNRGQGQMMSSTLDQAMAQLQTDYQSWLNKQMGSGAFGLTGTTLSF